MRIPLENREKEKKIIEEEENKAIEEEDERIRDITEVIAMELDEEDEVKAKLFETKFSPAKRLHQAQRTRRQRGPPVH